MYIPLTTLDLRSNWSLNHFTPRGCCEYCNYGCLWLYIDAKACYSTYEGVRERTISKNQIL